MLTSTGNHLLPVNASPARLSRLQGNKGLCGGGAGGWIRRGYGFDGRGRRWGQRGAGGGGGGEGGMMGRRLSGECRPLLVERGRVSELFNTSIFGGFLQQKPLVEHVFKEGFNVKVELI